MKRTVKLSESELKRMIAESVRMVLRETKLKGDFSDLFTPNFEQHIPKKTKRKTEDEIRKQEHKTNKRQAEYLKQQGIAEKKPQPYKIPSDYFDSEDFGQ